METINTECCGAKRQTDNKIISLLKEKINDAVTIQLIENCKIIRVGLVNIKDKNIICVNEQGMILINQTSLSLEDGNKIIEKIEDIKNSSLYRIELEVSEICRVIVETIDVYPTSQPDV